MSIGCFDNSIWDRHIELELRRYLEEDEEEEEDDPRDEYYPEDDE
jgi:hypothetical protein